MRVRCFCLAVFVALGVAQTVSASTFSQSDWPGGAVTISTFGHLSTGGGLANEATGGNPGSYVKLNADHAAGDYTIWTGVLVDAWVYNPSASGAISSIDFSADVTLGPGISSGGFQAFIGQGGNVYFGVGGFQSVSGWFNSSSSGATNSSFWELNTTDGSIDFSSHPDFSAAGGSLTFGYALGTDSIGASAGSDFVSYDNINYTIHSVAPVPEGASWVSLVIGIAALGGIRRLRYVQP